VRKQYNFSRGKRGRFFHPGVELYIPVYLDPHVAESVREHARKRNTSVGSLVNEWLRIRIRAEKQEHSLKRR